ncbi:hypothetical protein X975_08043, partial [Stegodyphus mimosarum]
MLVNLFRNVFFFSLFKKITRPLFFAVSHLIVYLRVVFARIENEYRELRVTLLNHQCEFFYYFQKNSVARCREKRELFFAFQFIFVNEFFITLC